MGPALRDHAARCDRGDEHDPGPRQAVVRRRGDPRLAVILPCFNEEAAIAPVVAAFRAALPTAQIFVYDNASTDGTAAVARKAGAIVRDEPMKGKGNAVRRAFADIEADIYLMADGDGTYEASDGPAMVDRLRRRRLDMVIGRRRNRSAAAYRPGHVLGNRLFSGLFRLLFDAETNDILSGYRVFSRRFIKSFPSTSQGFEIELEMSTHAALLRLPIEEMDTVYHARPAGGVSKLSTFSDGFRILRRMMRFLRLHRPLLLYGLTAGAGGVLSVFLATPIVLEYLATGLVPRFPTAILAASVMIAAFLVLSVGLVLDSQARYFVETKRLAYLGFPPPPALQHAPHRAPSSADDEPSDALQET